MVKVFNLMAFRINAVVLLLIGIILPSCFASRLFPGGEIEVGEGFLRYAEAPDYRNGYNCGTAALFSTNGGKPSSSYDPSLVHNAMTLDLEYLRGSIAAIHSVLKQALEHYARRFT